MKKKKTLYMETTKIEPEVTAAEIQVFLKNHGLSQFFYSYHDGEIDGVCFSLKLDGRDLPYKLPVNWKKIWQLAENGETKYIRDKQQAKRVSWRQILMWVKAQIAIVDTGMVQIEEVFLPYMLTNNNTTVFELFQNNQMALPSGTE
jgi:hypothetical protein